MPASSRHDPYAAFDFVVEIDGASIAGFSECSGLTNETEVIEYREGGEANLTRKLPGITKWSNIVLKRGIAGGHELWDWRKQIIDGVADRRSVSIVLRDATRSPVLRVNVRQAWPCKWEGPHLDARSHAPAIETLELAHEGFGLES